MSSLRPAVLVLATTAALACVPEPVRAQEGLRVDGRGGLTLPVGDLKDFNDLGSAIGAGLAYRVAPRWLVRVDYAGSFLPGADWNNVVPPGIDDAPPQGPSTDLHHATGSLQAQLSSPARAGWELYLHGGAGITVLSVEPTAVTEGGRFARFTLTGGTEASLAVTSGVAVVGRADLYLILDRGVGPPHLGKELTIPVSAGLRIDL